MGEAVILEDVEVKVMVVTKSAGVAGKLELLQRNVVGATGRQVIGPIVMLSPGGLKQRHLMLLSQVIFWSVIAWLLYYLILDPHFHMYLPHLLTGLDLYCDLLDMPICVSTPVGESVIVDKVYRSCLVDFMGRNTHVDLIILEMVDFDVILGMT